MLIATQPQPLAPPSGHHIIDGHIPWSNRTGYEASPTSSPTKLTRKPGRRIGRKSRLLVTIAPGRAMARGEVHDGDTLIRHPHPPERGAAR